MNKKKVTFAKAFTRLPGLNSKYGKDFIHFAIGFFITSFIALFTSIYVNKNLNQENLGRLTYYKSLLELLSFVFTFLLYRSYLRFNAQGVSRVAVRIVRAVSIFAVLALSIASFVLTDSVFAVFFAFFVLYEERLYFFRSIMDTGRLNILRIGAAAITFASVFFINYFYHLEGELVLMSYGLGFLISLFLFKKSDPVRENNEEVSLKKILLFSLPALGSVLIKVSQDFWAQFFIKEYFDFSLVSTFSIAMRVLLAVKLFSSLLMMYYPSIYFREIKKKNRTLIHKIRLYMSGFMMLVCTVAIIFANQLYVLMGANEYLDYVLYFRILVLAELLFIIGGFFGTYLAYILKTHVSMVVFGLGSVINITLLLIFLQSHGVVVAAYAILATNIFIFSFHVFYTRRLEGNYLLST
jgi:O-antigen/teichoic acid export membrane protein